MQAFLAALDLDYQSIYTCEQCNEDNMTVVIDGKEMGIRHTHFKSNERPWARDAAEVPIDWCAFSCRSFAYFGLLAALGSGSAWHGMLCSDACTTFYSMLPSTARMLAWCQ